MNYTLPLTERGERRKGKTRKNEIWVKPKMDVTLEETLHSIESIWLPQNQANVSFCETLKA